MVSMKQGCGWLSLSCGGLDWDRRKSLRKAQQALKGEDSFQLG